MNLSLDSSAISLVNGLGTMVIILYLIRSAKEVMLRWMELQIKLPDPDLLGGTELRYRGGKLRPVSPIPLTTLHVPSAEVPTTPPQEGSTSWLSQAKRLLGVDPASVTPSSGS